MSRYGKPHIYRTNGVWRLRAEQSRFFWQFSSFQELANWHQGLMKNGKPPYQADRGIGWDLSR